jgi:hypothetical protein
VAVLTDEQRHDVAVTFMQQAFGPLTLLKVDIRAAVDALDGWYDANAASANQALPQPARAELTLSDKALLSNLIVNKRYVRDVTP